MPRLQEKEVKGDPLEAVSKAGSGLDGNRLEFDRHSSSLVPHWTYYVNLCNIFDIFRHVIHSNYII